jgi:3-hydroxyanthranilate 3,4-dioxygenase
MHRDQLSIMFVGGPNRREDFHIEAGSEFFYQIKGDMELPTVQAGRRELVSIREGDVYLLPSCIPHSPQRPHEGSIGLVVERQRYETEPPDGLRYYVDFQTCEDVLWEQYFHCYDLGRDLVPVVNAFKQSEACKTGRPTSDSIVANPPLTQDRTTVVPPPFNLNSWLERHADELDTGASLSLFDGHPDGMIWLPRVHSPLPRGRMTDSSHFFSLCTRAGEFKIHVVGGESTTSATWQHETLLLQLRGDATVRAGGETIELAEGCCCIVPAHTEYTISRPCGSRGLVLTNDPLGNVMKQARR